MLKISNLLNSIYFFLRKELLRKMENDDISVSIKTEEISGKLTIHVPVTLMF